MSSTRVTTKTDGLVRNVDLDRCVSNGARRKPHATGLAACLFWPKADIPIVPINVRFRGKADVSRTCRNVCF
jgi:hypothetical protein